MLTLDKTTRTPIYEQIIEGLQREILLGILKPLDQLPSIREVAVMLSANPNTVQKSYILLEERGIIQMQHGKGCFVSENAYQILNNRLRTKLSDIKALTNELALAGIPKEEIISVVESSYKNATEKK
ncbi:MAG: GntR family transcriptional regulator [Clostridia bacterium]|nr:GntR family transcriptional regulator [Clostridia bacterium]